MTSTFRHDRRGTGASAWDGFVNALGVLNWAEVLIARRVAVVAPHPDDESLGAGGLIAGLLASGQEVIVVVCSDGEAAQVPTSDRSTTRHDPTGELKQR